MNEKHIVLSDETVTRALVELDTLRAENARLCSVKLYGIAEKRASWLLGVLTGWLLCGAWVTRSWELVLLSCIGLYGLFDHETANRKLRASEKTKVQP